MITSLLLAIGLAAAPPLARAARAAPERARVVPGLSAPVRIVVDRYGVSHLRAASLADLYFAWGYVTARDRLWQLEYTRQAARGELWRWFGNSALRADGGAQLFEFRERAARIWARDRAHPELALAMERYAAGINAFIDRCRAGDESWPPELTRLRARPTAWRPEDSVALLLGLGVTLDLDLPELSEGVSIDRYGMDWTIRRRRFEGQWIYDSIPDSAALRLYGAPATAAPRRARATTRASAPALEPEFPQVAGDLLRDARACLAPLLAERDPDGASRASNVFAVGPRRSASGAPLFANDPHLTLATPGPFHVIHLSVPGVLDAIGASVPGLPAIVSGRSARCAWGVTALGADMLDLYADTLSSDGRRVKTAEGWAALREAPYDLRYALLGIPLPPFGQVRRYTPHGPVVAFDRRRGIALSVRWSALEDRRISLAGLVGVERSASAAEVARRFGTLVTPGVNLVVADRGGDVVYRACGLLPRRRLIPPPGPLPSNGRYEWAGFIEPDSMPAWHVPPQTFVVNSNNRPVGAAYPEAWPRFDWAHDRALRIAQRLGGDPSLTLADLRSVQNDVYARAGVRIVPLLIRRAESEPGRLTPRMREALDTLRAWDFVARRDRVAPTLFRAWTGALTRRSRVEGLQGLLVAALDGRAPDALRGPGGEAPESPASAAIAALDTALTRLSIMLGPDLARWTWGRVHRARFRHELSDFAHDGRGAWEPAPIAVDGDGSSPAVAPSRLPWNTEVTHGPAWRVLVDLAIADSALGVVPPGNAGSGPHQRDLLARWAGHGYVPLYLAWDRIEAAKESELTLNPAR
jgi:penicillin amidase